MKKISLVTYHYSPNVGAVLQTYALCRFLKERGYEVEIVDIRNFEPTLNSISEGSPLPVRLLKSFIYPRRIKKIFRQYYPALTNYYKSIDELKANPPASDYYIVGSDQVWNPVISRDKVLAYFLDFGPDSVKRLSYASSFGVAKWDSGPNTTTAHVRRCLDRFSALSVRELDGQSILKTVFEKDATVVLDPTFLNYSYPEISGKIKSRREIVCYKLEKTSDFWKCMPMLSEKMRMPILLLNHNYPKKGYRYHFNPTVKQWVARIAGSSFVITDSFHGVAFSIIYKKQFAVVINHNGKESRILSLLKLLRLEDRVFDSVEELSQSECWKFLIDYKSVDSLLSHFRKLSIDYLLEALDNSARVI